MNRLFTILLLLCFGIADINAAGLDFVANNRQWPAEVRYRSSLPGGAVFLTNTGFVYSYYDQNAVERLHAQIHDGLCPVDVLSGDSVDCHAYRVSLSGCNQASLNAPDDQAPNYYNYFLGSDSSRWAGNTPAYRHVSYRNVYPEIDLSVYSDDGAFKYDFIVAPGGKTDAIRLRFEGVTPKITPDGDLLIRTGFNTVLEKAPYAYQLIDGKRNAVACRYALHGNTVSFQLMQRYDRSRPLIIDPVLVFATYSGSTATTFGWSATGDSAGNVYVAGECFDVGWPVSLGAFRTTFGGMMDASINKYSSGGSTLIYSTYYGGEKIDLPNAVTANAMGELVMAGVTQSAALPVTAGCHDNSLGGSTDIYVVHFNAAGSGILGGTYLGGNGVEGSTVTSTGYNANSGDVLTDSSGNIYVAFWTGSADFPATAGAFQTVPGGGTDAFVSKLSADCSSLIFSTYLGGSGNDGAVCLQRRPDGNLVVGGNSGSTNFPGVSGKWQPANAGSIDGFIAILDSNGRHLRHATYLGTSGFDDVAKVYVDAGGNIFATGAAISGMFPVSGGTYVTSGAMNYVIELDSTLNKRVASTTIGGPLYSPSAFMIDVCGNIYFIGHGNSNASVPVTKDALQPTPGGFWLAVLNPGMTSLRYASFFGEPQDHIDGGSSRLDPNGVVYHAICTAGRNLPTTSASWSQTNRSPSQDIAAWKFDFGLSGMRAAMELGPDSLCAPATITPRNTSVGARSYRWDFGDGSSGSTSPTPPPHTYDAPGTYTVRLYTYNRLGCQPVDSVIRDIHVFDRDTVRLAAGPLLVCGTDSIRIRVKPDWTVTVTPSINVRYQQTGGTAIVLYPDKPEEYIITAVSPGYCHVPPSDTLRIRAARDTTTIAAIDPFTDTLLCNRDTAFYRLGRKPQSLTIQPASYCSISKDSLTVMFFPPQKTEYTVTAVSRNRCDTIRQVQRFNVTSVRVKAAFGLSPQITDRTEPDFKLSNQSTNANAYEWRVNDDFLSVQTHPGFTAGDTGRYCFTLLATNDFCVDTATECGRLIETHIYMPNAFTPNGDNKNDYFGPIATNARVLGFSVFNRYGQRIFTSFENRHSWDGTFGGVRCDMGTYFYQLRYQILDREPQLLKGDVTLVR